MVNMVPIQRGSHQSINTSTTLINPLERHWHMNNQSQLTTRGRYTGADVSHQGTSYDEINRASVEAFLQLVC